MKLTFLYKSRYTTPVVKILKIRAKHNKTEDKGPKNCLKLSSRALLQVGDSDVSLCSMAVFGRAK